MVCSKTLRDSIYAGRVRGRAHGLYGSLIGPENFATVWGSPQGGLGDGFSYVFRLVSAFLVAGFFTRAAYVFRRDWKPRKSINPL
jgi:hypothetical protein